MAISDPRIGQFVNGKRVYPEVDIFGQAYNRNGCTIHGLDKGVFVVLPTFRTPRIVADMPAKLAELRALAAPNAPPVDDAKKGK